jgi:hypothetical protein
LSFSLRVITVARAAWLNGDHLSANDILFDI